MSFPLYDILLKDCNDNDLADIQKKEIIPLINSLDDKGHENIFTIIRIHGVLKNKTKEDIFDIPYNGKKIDKQIKFNLSKLPNIVKQMIYKFSQIHKKRMEEEETVRLKI